MADDQNPQYKFVPKGSPDAKTSAPAPATTFVPKQQPAAAPQGGGVSQSDMDKAAQPWQKFTSGAGTDPSNLLSNAASGFVGGLKGVYNLARHPIDTYHADAAARAHQGELARAPYDYENHPYLSALESVGHSTAEALPLVGPWAASIGDQAATGDVGGAAANGIGGYYGAKLGMKAVGSLSPVRVTPSEPVPVEGLRGIPILERGTVPSGMPSVEARVPPAATFLKGAVKDIPIVRGGMKAIEAKETEAADARDEARQRATSAKLRQLMSRDPATVGEQDDYIARLPNPPKVEVVNPKAEAPATQAEVDQAANQTMQEHKMAQYNEKYAPGSNGSMIRAAKGDFQITPEGVKPAAPSSAEINDMATKEIEKIQGKDSPEQAAARNMMKHRVPADLQDKLVRDHPDIAMKLVSGTNANFAEMANELGMPGAKGDMWNASDFGRSGSEMSPKKAMVMRHLMENYAPEEVINMTDHWGGKAKK